MSAYRPLLDLQVEHPFYAGGRCRGLVFHTSDDTLQRLQRAVCVWRATESGIALHAERGRIERFFGDGEEPFTLGFVAHSCETAFVAATAGLNRAGDGRFLLTRLLPADDETVFLQADAECLEPLDSPAWAGLWPAAKGPRMAPAFGLRLLLPDARPRRCVMRFASRALPWKYYLVGAWEREGLYLADADGALEFAALVPERLSDGREVMAARSTVAIALAERPRQHIQLRRRGKDSDRVIVKRLPVATANAWGPLPGGGGPVAEIYVNR